LARIVTHGARRRSFDSPISSPRDAGIMVPWDHLFRDNKAPNEKTITLAEEVEPRKIQRADVAPADGLTPVVDGGSSGRP
jgi:hypothetical protein